MKSVISVGNNLYYKTGLLPEFPWGTSKMAGQGQACYCHNRSRKSDWSTLHVLEINKNNTWLLQTLLLTAGILCFLLVIWCMTI